MEWLSLLRELIFVFAYVGSTGSFPEPLSSAEERETVLRMGEGDETAREKLILHNLRLVAHIAKKYARAGRELDDLISTGTIGLIKAVSTYNLEKGVPLSSYASRCVENEMLMRIRAERKQVFEVSLSESIGVDSDGNDISFCDILGTEPGALQSEVEARMDAEAVRTLLARALTSREQTVVRLRFGILCGYRMPQREIAELLGISRSYVSRIEKKALRKLRDMLSTQ